ncbi:hypothetical protein SVIOM74S_05637 [Streptomyces violarus]
MAQGAAHGPQHRVPVGGRGAVRDGRHAPHGRLDDRGERAVPVRMEPRRLDGGLRYGRGQVGPARRRYPVDGGPEAGPVQGVVGAQLAGDAEPGRGVRDTLGEPGQIVRELDEAAADVHAVQGALEERPQFVLDAEQGAGLRQGRAGRAVGQPFGLFQEAGPEEAPEVPAEGVRAGEPALVAAQPVRVEAQQQVPGGVGALGEPRVGQRPLGQAQHGGSAHGFVGVGAGDDEGLAAAVPDGEQPHGRARAGRADPAQPGLTRVAGDEGGGPGAQFVDGRVAREGRQGTPPQCGAVASPAVHGVHTVSHDFGGTSTPPGATGFEPLPADRQPVNPRPELRHGSVSGQSADSRNDIRPKPTWSPSRTTAAPTTRRPFTVVPLVEPRSRSTHMPPW